MVGPDRQTPATAAAALAGIRRAAEETLAAWPDARAAVLFGSRARGDHLPSSDWDVAFITRSGDRVTPIPDGLPIRALRWDVQALALPEAVARLKALSIGHVGREIVRDGRLLAGGWNRPRPEGEPTMEPERYLQFIANTSNFIETAASAVAKAGMGGNWRDANFAANHFVSATADAAEHLAKAMLGRRGIDPFRRHDVDDLADQAVRAGHSALAEDIRKMDGFTREDHVAGYDGTNADRLGHAADRLPIVIQRLALELASAAEDPKLADVVARAARVVADSATTAEDILRLATVRDTEGRPPPPPYQWLAPLVGARDALLPEILGLQADLRPLVSPDPERDRGAWRSPSPFD